ncbi:hypothetical protein Esti_006684 [Eimeria stiedai]
MTAAAPISSPARQQQQQQQQQADRGVDSSVWTAVTSPAALPQQQQTLAAAPTCLPFFAGLSLPAASCSGPSSVASASSSGTPLHASTRHYSHRKRSRSKAVSHSKQLLRMSFLFYSCFFAAVSCESQPQAPAAAAAAAKRQRGCLVYWVPATHVAMSLVLTLGCSFVVFSRLERLLRRKKLPRLLARAAPLTPSCTPELLTGAFLLLDAHALSGPQLQPAVASYTPNNFTGVSLSLHTLMTALWRWGKGGFELVAGEETAVLQRSELLQLLQPQLLQHSIFACALCVLLGSSGELQLAGFLLTLMAAILRGALLLQLAAAAHAECTHVLLPILKALYRQPALLLDALKNPVAAVQSAWSLSTGALQRLLLLLVVACLCVSFLLHLIRLGVVCADVFDARRQKHKHSLEHQHQQLMQQKQQIRGSSSSGGSSSKCSSGVSVPAAEVRASTEKAATATLALSRTAAAQHQLEAAAAKRLKLLQQLQRGLTMLPVHRKQAAADAAAANMRQQQV